MAVAACLACGDVFRESFRVAFCLLHAPLLGLFGGKTLIFTLACITLFPTTCPVPCLRIAHALPALLSVRAERIVFGVFPAAFAGIGGGEVFVREPIYGFAAIRLT